MISSSSSIAWLPATTRRARSHERADRRDTMPAHFPTARTLSNKGIKESGVVSLEGIKRVAGSHSPSSGHRRNDRDPFGFASGRSIRPTRSTTHNWRFTALVALGIPAIDDVRRIDSPDSADAVQFHGAAIGAKEGHLAVI